MKMMNLSNILPTLRFSSINPNKAISISIATLRTSSGRYRNATQFSHASAEPQSSYGLANEDSSTSQSFCIGGVKVLSQRYSHASNLVQSDDKSGTAVNKTFKLKPKSPRASNPDNRTTNFLKREKIANNVMFKDAVKKANDKRLSISTDGALTTKGRSAITNNKAHSKVHITKRRIIKASTNGTKGVNSSSYASDRPPNVVKVFLSQKQSTDIRTVGKSSAYPGAPPGSPTPDTLKHYNYIPCLSDNLAKQQVSSKLKVIKQTEADRTKAKQMEKEKVNKMEAKGREQQEKKMQRRLIYALNQTMTAVENQQFEVFKRNQVLKPKEYPSPTRKSNSRKGQR